MADKRNTAEEREPAEEQDAREPESPPGMKPGWFPRDLLVPHILLAVSVQRAHGYMIDEYLKGLGFLTVEMSTLYRTLRQLESDGLLWSTWEPGPSGPARRVYSLTDSGRQWLDGWTAPLRVYSDMIERFFDLYQQRQPSEEEGAASPSRERGGEKES